MIRNFSLTVSSKVSICRRLGHTRRVIRAHGPQAPGILGTIGFRNWGFGFAVNLRGVHVMWMNNRSSGVWSRSF